MALLNNEIEDLISIFETFENQISIDKMNDLDETLALAYYRINDFQKSAKYHDKIGRNEFSDYLRSFTIPYKVSSFTDAYHVKFIMSDPLPLIEVTINESQSYYFIIDTGGPETIIDKTIADQFKLVKYNLGAGKFAGGKSANLSYGILNSIRLGDLKMDSIPVLIGSTLKFSTIFGGKYEVSGVLGTLFLYQFLSTIDYVNGKLILRLKGSRIAGDNKPIGTRFWLAGKHIILTKAIINGVDSTVMVDTGLAGGGFCCSQNQIVQLNQAVDEKNQFQGVGGAGKVTAVPFTLDELILANLQRKNLPSILIYNNPDQIQGYKFNGIISHQFFRSSCVTFDFKNMRLFIS